MNLLDLLRSQASTTPDAIALMAPGRPPLTFAQLSDRLAQDVANLSALGLGSNDRVALLLPQGADLALWCLATMGVCTALPLNPDMREAEYLDLFNRLEPAALIMFEDKEHPACIASQTVGIALLELNAAAVSGFALQFDGKLPATGGSQDDTGEPPAILLQTSGTTSRAKIVPLTHRNLLASAENLIRSLDLRSTDRCLHFLPMFHVGGIVDVLLAPLLSGGSVVCAPAFSVDGFCRYLDEFSPTWTQAVPIVLEEVLTQSVRYGAQLDGMSRLRFWRSVSAPLRADRLAEFEQRFGVPVIEIYGMSETAGVITSNPLSPSARKPGSVGVSAGPSVQILSDTGLPVPPEIEGEVLVRGANVMPGYLDASPGEASSLRPDGWLRTGDLGFLDREGYLFLTGRVKELINRGGEKVSPREIDAVLLAHPAIGDAATFAVPHPSLGEEVAALVVLKPGVGNLQPRDVIDFAKERVAFYKVPRLVKIVDAIPRGANGKLRRAALAELLGPEQDGRLPHADAVKPVVTPIARLIASWWSNILGVTVSSLNENFFDIGGNSLKATSFINRLQDEFGDLFYVSSVFDAPTVAQYERFILDHYPPVAARILGDAVTLPRDPVSRVTPEMLGAFTGMINRPSPTLTPAVRNPPAIFILCTPRSGSTLLRAMLAGHTSLFSPPELYLLPFDTLSERKSWFEGSQRGQLEGNIRALMQLTGANAVDAAAIVEALEVRGCPTHEYYLMLQRMAEGRLLVDKTPDYAMDPNVLRHAEACFENAFYVHLVRHPYGMIRSFEEARLDQLWLPRLVRPIDGTAASSPFATRQFAEMVWMTINRNILDFLQTIPASRYVRLAFEDLVSQPRPILESICDLVGFPFEQSMLTPHDDRTTRMTDGIHDVSRMIGDPKFHRFSGIETNVADQWKTAYTSDFLSEDCLRIASAIGYDETLASLSNRVEFEI